MPFWPAVCTNDKGRLLWEQRSWPLLSKREGAWLPTEPKNEAQSRLQSSACFYAEEITGATGAGTVWSAHVRVFVKGIDFSFLFWSPSPEWQARLGPATRICRPPRRAIWRWRGSCARQADRHSHLANRLLAQAPHQPLSLNQPVENGNLPL